MRIRSSGKPPNKNGRCHAAAVSSIGHRDRWPIAINESEKGEPQSPIHSVGSPCWKEPPLRSAQVGPCCQVGNQRLHFPCWGPQGHRLPKTKSTGEPEHWE